MLQPGPFQRLTERAMEGGRERGEGRGGREACRSSSTALMSLLQASTRGLPALTVALRRRRRTGTKRVRVSRRPASQSKYGSLISESRSHRLTLFAPGGGERSTGKQTNNNKKNTRGVGGALWEQGSFVWPLRAAQRAFLHHMRRSEDLTLHISRTMAFSFSLRSSS